MKRNHIDVMLDLETLALDSKAVITQIGASTFDLREGDLGDVFERITNPMSGVAAGGVIDGSTVEWWMKQDRKTINSVLVRAISKGVEIQDALQDFSKYIEELREKYKVKTVYLWGNGSKADNVWLENAFKCCGIKWPFSYRDDMDLRTLIRLAKEFGIDLKDSHPFDGNRHVAIDDVRHQINYASNSFKELVKLTKASKE